MGTLLRRCVEVRTAIELSLGMVSGVGPCIHVLDGSPRISRGRVCFWHGFWHFSKIRLCWFQWRHGVLIMVLIDFWLVCEKLTIFPYAEYIVEFCVRVAFLWYSQVQDRRRGWHEIHVQKRNSKHKRASCRSGPVAVYSCRHIRWPRPTSPRTVASTCQGCAIPVICYSFYPPRSDALFSNYFEEDLFWLLSN